MEPNAFSHQQKIAAATSPSLASGTAPRPSVPAKTGTSSNKAGSGTWICSQCRSSGAFNLLQGVLRWTFSEAARQVDRIVETVQPGPIAPERTDASNISALTQVWEGSRPVTRGDPGVAVP